MEVPDLGISITGNFENVSSLHSDEKKQGNRRFDEFEESYHVGNILGKGGFGTVYSGVRVSDGVQVAIKYVTKRKVRAWVELGKQHVPLEVCLLKQLDHVPGVIKLLDYFDGKDSCLIIMERPDQAKDLFDYVTEKVCLKESVARGFFKQIVETVIECHNAGVIHRDIKQGRGSDDHNSAFTSIVFYKGDAHCCDSCPMGMIQMCELQCKL